MPQADFTASNRSDAGQSKFPKLKLQLNERARIVVVSSAATEYVHNLRAPNIVNMAPTYVKIKNREGLEEFVVNQRFVAAPVCLGSYEVLRERGVDDKNCLACEMARERPDIFYAPRPKYSANILKYGLRPGGGWNDIAAPFGVSSLIWTFGKGVMDKLIDIRAMGEAYEDLRKVDLTLFCEDADFQKPYSNGDFTPVIPAVWLATDQTRSYTVQYLAANAASPADLEASIGRKPKPEYLADDIDRVIKRWDVVRAYESRQNGSPSMGPSGFGAETIGQGMANLQQQYGGQGGGSYAGHQVQYGGQGGSHAGHQAQNGSPGTASPGQVPSVGSGMDMSLLGMGNQQFQVPSPPGPIANMPAAASQRADALYAAAQVAQQQGQNPVVAAYETATGDKLPQGTGQWKPPGTEGDMFQPPVPPAPPTMQAPAAAGTTGGSATPASVSNPPVGLAGLQEFMKQTTSNPPFEPGPAQQPESPVPPPPPDVQSTADNTSPSTAKYTFEDLARLAQ